LAVRFGNAGDTLTAAIYIGLGLAGGGVVFLIDWMERRAGISTAPNGVVSKFIVGAVPFAFWIPFAGLLVCSLALYRSAWLKLPEWISFLMCCFFYLSVSITVVTVFILAMDYFGVR
jgi:hypothetical protein